MRSSRARIQSAIERQRRWEGVKIISMQEHGFCRGESLTETIALSRGFSPARIAKSFPPRKPGGPLVLEHPRGGRSDGPRLVSTAPDAASRRASHLSPVAPCAPCLPCCSDAFPRKGARAERTKGCRSCGVRGEFLGLCQSAGSSSGDG